MNTEANTSTLNISNMNKLEEELPLNETKTKIVYKWPWEFLNLGKKSCKCKLKRCFKILIYTTLFLGGLYSVSLLLNICFSFDFLIIKDYNFKPAYKTISCKQKVQ